MDTRNLRTGAAVIASLAALGLNAAEPVKRSDSFQIVTQRVIQSGDHQITVNKVQTPVLSPVERKIAKPTPEELAIEKRRESKQQSQLNLSATIFEDGKTELRWAHNGRRYHGYSNVNFLHFTGTGDLETADAVYSISLSMGRGELTEKDARILGSRKKALSVKNAEYVVDQIEGGAAEEEAYRGMDALHAFYELNRASLVRDFVAREADAQTRETYFRNNPPKTPDAEVNFWRVTSEKVSR